MMGERPDITAVLEAYGTTVHGLHGNRQISCPVHDERVPSCSVNLDKGVLLCHACGFAGDSISLIMEKEQCDYRSALAWAERNISSFEKRGPVGGRAGLDGSRGPGYRPRYRRPRTGLNH